MTSRDGAMLELAILGLLDENDLHGYELRKRLGDLLGLRRYLVRLPLSRARPPGAAGLVKVVSSQPVAAAPSPMTGSLAGELAAFGAQRRGRGPRRRRTARRSTASPTPAAGWASCWPTPTCPTTRRSPSLASAAPRPRRAPRPVRAAPRRAAPADRHRTPPGERAPRTPPALPAGRDPSATGADIPRPARSLIERARSTTDRPDH